MAEARLLVAKVAASETGLGAHVAEERVVLRKEGVVDETVLDRRPDLRPVHRGPDWRPALATGVDPVRALRRE